MHLARPYRPQVYLLKVRVLYNILLHDYTSSQSSSIKTCFPQSESESLTYCTWTPDRLFPDTEMEIIRCLILYIRLMVTEYRWRSVAVKKTTVVLHYYYLIKMLVICTPSKKFNSTMNSE